MTTDINVNEPETAFDWKKVLPQEDIDILNERYGSCLENVRMPDDEEAGLLSCEPQSEAGMIVQQQFRLKSKHMLPPPDVAASKSIKYAYAKSVAKMVITPFCLEHKLRMFMLQNKVLRTSYYTATNGEVYAVEANVNLPLHSISFYKATDNQFDSVDEHFMYVMRSDRHRPFDLAVPFLPRIIIYALSHNEYAVIISQPLILAGRWNVLKFLSTLLYEDDFAEELPVFTLPKPSSYLAPTSDRKALQAYWERYLYGVSALPELPGYLAPLQKPQNLRIEMRTLEEPALAALWQLCPNGEKNALIALLSTLWGLSLQYFSKSNDVFFPVLLPADNQSEVEQVLQSACCALPVRLQSLPLQRVNELVGNKYRELMEGMKVGLPTAQECRKMIGTYQGVNHALSFQYLEAMPDLALPEVSGINYSDLRLNSLADALRINFHLRAGKLILETTYYEEAFTREYVNLVLDRFMRMLELAPKYWLVSNGELLEAAFPVMHKNLNDTQNAILNRILSKAPLFAKLPPEQMKVLTVGASVYELPYYEVVQSVGMQQNNILLLLSGNVMRQCVNSEGWLVPLNIIAPGELINEQALVDNVSNIYCEVISDTAVIVAIPASVLRKLLQMPNEFSVDLVQYLVRQLSRYQRLWMTI